VTAATDAGPGHAPADAAARIATDFFAALGRGDVETAFRAVAPDAPVVIHPTGQSGGPEVARGFFTEAVTAFPDLLLKVGTCRGCSDGRALVELTFEGTQAADFLGAINQEKHLDIEQAWVLATDGEVITALTGYWDQNKLYRRLAVKRLDQIAIA
jgi:ketosteroid isomerase-like protein